MAFGKGVSMAEYKPTPGCKACEEKKSECAACWRKRIQSRALPDDVVRWQHENCPYKEVKRD
jgi:hypothetical protein